ncbi:MAG: hypothetical protein Q8P01_01310 [bacterium]|nr:hypothetical protein [bacterium]
MKKSYLIAVVSAIVLFILVGAGYWYTRSGKTEVQVTTETPDKEVAPSVSTNPLDNKPDINPVDQTNPFKNIKTNPFE